MSTTHRITEFFVDTVEPASPGFSAVQVMIEATKIRPAPVQGFFTFDSAASSQTLAPAHLISEGEAVA